MLLNSDAAKLFDEHRIEKSDVLDCDAPVKQIICLDALDEVKTAELDNAYTNIQNIAKDFKKAAIVVSARINRSEKYTELTKRVSFRYLKILKFNTNQLNEYLKENLSEANRLTDNCSKEAIINNIQKVNSEIILIPRYLSYILNLLKIDTDFFKKKLTRSNIMEKVLLEKVSSEEEEYEERMKLRVFGKLALTMEIHQVKEITIDDFISFFELINSKVCERTYYRDSIKELYNNTVLKYNHGMLGFENAEIQEYLAARELNLLNDSETRLYDIVTDNPASIIFPYWKNTISYYIDMNPHAFLNILKYDYRTDVDHQSSITEILAFIDLNEYTEDEQIEISTLILNYSSELI